VKDNLIVFVTPTIVQDEDFQPTKTDFLKTPVPTKDSVEPPWSSWDSGKPRDWSKPEPDADKYSSLPPKSSQDSQQITLPPSASKDADKPATSPTATAPTASTTSGSDSDSGKFASLPTSPSK
jgi:hypothetical protein